MSGRRSDSGESPAVGADRPPLDEFDFIAEVLRPLAANAPEALGLADDAAVLPARPGFDLVVTQDAIVEGVHFLSGDPPDLVARKLLRTNLSDLAAKAAEPYGYLLTTAWPAGWGRAARARFVRGLAEDQAAFGLKLFGGDTVSSPGPAMFSVTLMGWSAAGRMVRRSGARPGDRLFVSGTIGDGWLGLKTARGELALDQGDLAFLISRYRLPEPRLDLRLALAAHASAALDVSDGLIADAGHLAAASGVAVTLDLARMPLSAPAKTWWELEAEPTTALAALASGGDDYEVLCTVPNEAAQAFAEAAAGLGVAISEVGGVGAGEGVQVFYGAQSLNPRRTGYRHV